MPIFILSGIPEELGASTENGEESGFARLRFASTRPRRSRRPRRGVRRLPVLRSPSSVAPGRRGTTARDGLRRVDSTAEGGAGNRADAALPDRRQTEAKASFVSRSDEPHRREEGSDAARITSEQGQMGDVGVRADEEIRKRTSFLTARPAVFLEGFAGLKSGIEQ